MIIFAKKHFEGQQAQVFVAMLQVAIYLRAFLTLLTNFLKKIYLPLLDSLLIIIGLYWLKNVWATYYFQDKNYYNSSFLFVNIPLYTLIWLTTAYFSGGYDDKNAIGRLVRGWTVGTFFLAAVYGFLPMSYRTSRALIVMGAAWTAFSTICLRLILHFFKYKNFNISQVKTKNTVIVGSKIESERVLKLLYHVQVQKNIIGIVSPDLSISDPKIYLCHLDRLAEIVPIYRINEIIFCAKDVSSEQIMHQMVQLGEKVEYKILPPKSLSIIGSSSKNTAGELYTIEVSFNIDSKQSRRNKRVIDILICIFIILLLPLFLFWRTTFSKNLLSVLFGKKTWVGYAKTKAQQSIILPHLRESIFSPASTLPYSTLHDDVVLQRLNFLYAKNYRAWNDLEIIITAK